mmetsp:Transcript_25342/g.70891  ORF Transcript_25342/g.70891 Transcript_25342/m.70891 type:complete len:453 (+) Transcript_25342:253-1611(+)
MSEAESFTGSELGESTTGLKKGSWRSASFAKLGEYFREGQLLATGDKERRPPPDEDALWVYKTFIYDRPRLAGILIPAVLVHIMWWSYVIPNGKLSLYQDNWYAAVVMIFGSMIAGATSEGGASIAFPILTLVFGVEASTARDFGMMIQTFGMTSATFTILYQQITVGWRAIWYCTLGGIPGVFIGLGLITPFLPSNITKITFVSVWLAFAAALFMLNLNSGRHVFLKVERPKPWKNWVLVIAGFIGGILTSLSGSGIDICAFAILTLLFRVTEKVATPTSVILMAINTSIGFWFKDAWLGGMDPQAWDFLIVSIPVVVVGAPLGAFLGSYCHRLVLASFVYVTDTAQYVAATVIVLREVSNPAAYGISSGCCVVVGWVFFYWLTRRGTLLLDAHLATQGSTDQPQKVVDVASTPGSLEVVQAVEGTDEVAIEMGHGTGPSNHVSLDKVNTL